MNFSVCVDAVYYGHDFYESVQEIAENGISNIEFWTWWDKDLKRLLELKEKYHLNIVAFCTKFYSLVNPDERKDYLNAFAQTVEVARQLGCRQIITKPGDSTRESFEVQYQNMLETLRAALKIAERNDITILLEPVNSTLEAPNTFLDNSALGFRIVDELNSEHCKLLYDIYHMQIDEGDILRRVSGNIAKIGHFHAAGITDRHELEDGEINYPYLFDQIEKLGYKRYTGLEYFPIEAPIKGLRAVICQK